jgi:hypothetical protein
MRNTFQTTLLLSLCLSCFCIHMSLASEPSQDIRKKLFLIGGIMGTGIMGTPY